MRKLLVALVLSLAGTAFADVTDAVLPLRATPAPKAAPSAKDPDAVLPPSASSAATNPKKTIQTGDELLDLQKTVKPCRPTGPDAVYPPKGIYVVTNTGIFAITD
jgi:hypothetical protein